MFTIFFKLHFYILDFIYNFNKYFLSEINLKISNYNLLINIYFLNPDNKFLENIIR
jgi:hypothetical protein